MNFDIKLVPVKSLRPSPKTLAVHPPFEADGRDHLLLASIREKGILEPLKIHPDGVIEDGYRRSECARFLKMAKVPAMILADGLEIFEDMQLGRQLSVFAVCSLQRVRIEELVSRGKQLRVPKRGETQSTALQELGEEWAKLVQVFGKKKRTLQLGASTLARIDELCTTEPQKAAAAEARFRESGLLPTVTLLDLWEGKSPEPTSTNASDEEDEIDARDIDYEIEEQLSPEPAKPAVVKPRPVPMHDDEETEESEIVDEVVVVEETPWISESDRKQFEQASREFRSQWSGSVSKILRCIFEQEMIAVHGGLSPTERKRFAIATNKLDQKVETLPAN